MEASDTGREPKTVFWKLWEKSWWLFALAFLGGMVWACKAFGNVALFKFWAFAFACLGAAILVYGWRARRFAAASISWFPTQARVLHSEVIEERQSSSTYDGINADSETVSYYPDIEYEYEVQGERRRSNQVLLVRVNYSAEEARATVAKYPKGAAVSAWYDPRHPARVVLEPGLRGAESKYRIPLLVGLGFLLLGISTLAVLEWLRL